MNEIFTVRQAWEETISSTGFDLARPWRKSGVKSGQTVNFLLRIEELLGRELPLDLIEQDMCLGDLVRVIDAGERPVASNPGRPPDPCKPTLFLVPGIYGDEPILAQFRRALASEFDFELLALPDIDQSLWLLRDISATGSFISDQIEQRRPEGPVAIAGYSFGGLAAFETACELQRRGRSVQLVGLLDAWVETLNKVDGAGKANNALRRRPDETTALFLERALFGACMRMGWLELARRVALKAARRSGPRANLRHRRHLLERLRLEAQAAWRPTPCSAPVLLIAGDDYARSAPRGFWNAICPNLIVRRAPGRHCEIFDPDAMRVIGPALRDALGPLPAA